MSLHWKYSIQKWPTAFSFCVGTTVLRAFLKAGGLESTVRCCTNSNCTWGTTRSPATRSWSTSWSLPTTWTWATADTNTTGACSSHGGRRVLTTSVIHHTTWRVLTTLVNSTYYLVDKVNINLMYYLVSTATSGLQKGRSSSRATWSFLRAENRRQRILDLLFMISLRTFY